MVHYYKQTKYEFDFMLLDTGIVAVNVYQKIVQAIGALRCFGAVYIVL